jgi:chromosomal replication initiation ATPase DnaA
MYKAIKDNKIIAINETGEFPCMEIGINIDEVIEDTEHTIDDYKHYDGEFTLHNIEKDNEEAKQARANAYAQEVDPLMSEYNRKKTFNLFEEGEEETLKQEIQDKVAEIKERFPYSEVKDDTL